MTDSPLFSLWSALSLRRKGLVVEGEPAVRSTAAVRNGPLPGPAEILRKPFSAEAPAVRVREVLAG